jgi:hypothetical protein
MLLVGLEILEFAFEVIDLGGLAALAGLIELGLQLGQVGFDVLQGSGVLGLLQLRAVRSASIPPFGVNRSVEPLHCQSGGRPRVCVIRRFRLLPLLAVVLLASCRSIGPSPQERERLAEQQRLLTLCERNQEQLPAVLKRFEAAQKQLASVRDSAYSPSAPPKPLDPDEQRRLTIYDQQTEQDLYEQAVDAWRRQESERRERYERAYAQREAAAVEQLTTAAAAVRQIHPELLLAGTPPRLNNAEVERFSRCQPERFR